MRSTSNSKRRSAASRVTSAGSPSVSQSRSKTRAGPHARLIWAWRLATDRPHPLDDLQALAEAGQPAHEAIECPGGHELVAAAKGADDALAHARALAHGRDDLQVLVGPRGLDTTLHPHEHAPGIASPAPGASDGSMLASRLGTTFRRGFGRARPKPAKLFRPRSRLQVETVENELELLPGRLSGASARPPRTVPRESRRAVGASVVSLLVSDVK